MMRCERSKIRKHLVVYTLFVCLSFFCLAGTAFAFELEGKWGAPAIGTSGGIVTWSLMPTGVTGEEGNPPSTFASLALADFMPTGFKEVIELAFDAWSTVANIQFVEITDGGEAFNAQSNNITVSHDVVNSETTIEVNKRALSGHLVHGDSTIVGSADIRIGGHFFDGPGGELAHAFFPPFPPVNGGAAGDIHFDSSETWDLDDAGSGFNLFRVATHEIGHSIGLGHEDDVVALMNSFYTESTPLGLLADDIAGAQYLYGKRGPLIYDPTKSTSDLLYGNSTSTAPVPEPATIALLGIGLVGLAGGAARRKWKKKAVDIS